MSLSPAQLAARKTLRLLTGDFKIANSRQEAKDAGKPYYFGKPCPKGHIKRFTGSGTCAICLRYFQQKKRHPNKQTSRMVAIDRRQAQPDFLDNYYGD